MKRDTLPFLRKMLSLLLVTWIIGSVQQGIAESAVDIFTGPAVGKIWHERDGNIPEVKSIQLAGPSYTPDLKGYQKQEIHRKIQITLIGGFLLIIGTFFIPHLIPQFTGYHERLYRFFENTVKAYKTILQNSQNRFIPRAAITNPFSEKLKKTKKNVPLLENKDAAMRYYTIRCENILSPAYHLSMPKPSTIGIIRKFFQQSGFAFTKISDTELRVNSPLSRYNCYGEIPVYIVNDTVMDKSHVQQIYDKMNTHCHHLERKGLHGEIAFTVVTTPPDDSAYHQIYNYRVKNNFTIIPLSHAFVMKSIKHSSCAQELEEKVSISTKQCNLYAMNTPVADPLSFFGRGDVMQQLLDAINRQKYIVLFGLRKIGKTWLIWQFKEQLSHHIVAYVDLQRFSKNCSDFYRRIIDACIRDVGFKYPDLKLPNLHFTRTNYAENENAEFEQDLVSLGECLSTKSKEVKVVLLLDGADQLASGTPNVNSGVHGFHEFLTTIRRISQQHGFLVSILAVTSPEISRVDTLSSRGNLEFQNDQKVFLSSLSEEGCNHLINGIGAQMGLGYTEESLSRLYYETGGHPYITRQLCSLIVKNLRRSNAKHWTQDTLEQTMIQVRDVEQAVSEYLEYKSEYLESLWRQLSRVEQEILVIIATRHSCTRDELISKEHNHQVRGERTKAIATLIENDLVERCENKYSIKMGLFERLILTSN